MKGGQRHGQDEVLSEARRVLESEGGWVVIQRGEARRRSPQQIIDQTVEVFGQWLWNPDATVATIDLVVDELAQLAAETAGDHRVGQRARHALRDVVEQWKQACVGRRGPELKGLRC